MHRRIQKKFVAEGIIFPKYNFCHYFTQCICVWPTLAAAYYKEHAPILNNNWAEGAENVKFIF
jgi:hypothetical protein